MRKHDKKDKTMKTICKIVHFRSNRQLKKAVEEELEYLAMYFELIH